jgi:hypothetical protein
MKKLTLILVILLAVVISCKKEIPLNEALIGKWNVNSYTEIYYEENVKKGESTLYLYGNEMAIEFASSGTGILYRDGDVLGLFSWTLNGNTLTVTGYNPPNWDISIDKDFLTWSYSSDSVTYKTDYIYTAKKSN